MLDRTGKNSNTATTLPLWPLIASRITFQRAGRTFLTVRELAIGPNSKTIIMGPNGAGKSLLVRTLHNLIEPSSGHVKWANRKANTEILARQAMVFQRPMLLRRSALANIEFALRHKSSSTRRAQAEIALKNAGLLHLAKTSARLLSGGEQQRLAVARALASDPDVLFLDEPTTNLDPAATHAVEKMIEAAAASGTKIIMITHDRGQARRLADEVIFLDRGHVTELTPADQFFNKPKSEAARAYLAGELYLTPLNRSEDQE